MYIDISLYKSIDTKKSMGFLDSHIKIKVETYSNILLKSSTKAELINIKAVLLKNNIKVSSFDELIDILIKDFKDNNSEGFANG